MKRILVDKRIHSDISGGQYVSETGQKIDQINFLGKINILVGANNSGKSRFLRGLIKSNEFLTAEEDYLSWAKGIDLEISNIKNSLANGIADKITFKNLPDIKNFGVSGDENLAVFKRLANKEYQLSSVLNSLSEKTENLTAQNIEEFSKGLNNTGDLCKAFLYISTNIDDSHTLNSYLSSVFRQPSTKKTVSSLLEKLFFKIEEFNLLKLTVTHPKKIIYIPILRTLRALIVSGNKQSQDIFLETIKVEYFNNDNKDGREIFTGLHLYQDIFAARNSKMEQRKKIDQFQKFLSEYFFNNAKVEIVPQDAPDSKDSTILITLGDDEKEIHNVGDGIQSLILILWPIFNAEKYSWVFIEEPEMHLHPGMQRVFIEQLSSNAYIRDKNLTIFFSTHSNHLIDLALIMEKSLSVINFREKNGKKIISPVLTGGSEILKGLGVTNTSVFMAKCTIWLEGPSDVKIIRAYLKKYIENLAVQGKNPKKLIEDIDYAFFIYAGSNLAHYLFSQDVSLGEKDGDSYINGSMLSNNIFLLADKDFAKDETHAKRACEQHAGFTYKVLDSREIENTVPETLLKSILSNMYPKALSEGAIEDFQLSKKQYQNEYLGDYLKNTINIPNFPSSMVSTSGSLSSYAKNIFSTALSEIIADNQSQLDEECADLASQIYQFIMKNN